MDRRCRRLANSTGTLDDDKFDEVVVCKSTGFAVIRSMSGGIVVLGNSADEEALSAATIPVLIGRKLAVVGEANIKNRGGLRSSFSCL